MINLRHFRDSEDEGDKVLQYFQFKRLQYDWK